MNGHKDTLIDALDGKIQDLELLNSVNDSIINNDKVIFDNLKEIIDNKNKVLDNTESIHSIEKAKFRRQRKNLFLIIVAESILILLILSIK